MKNMKFLILVFLMIFTFASCGKTNEPVSIPDETVSHTLYDYDDFSQETTHGFFYDFTTAYENTNTEFSTSYTAYTKQTTVSRTAGKPSKTSVSESEVTAVRTTSAKPVVSTTVTTTARTATPSTTVKASTEVRTTVPSTTAKVTTPSTPSTPSTAATTTVHTHSYVSAVTSAPTCTQNGILTYTCSSCNHSYTEPIPSTGHDYKQSVVAPTCLADGYTLNACSKCPHSYKSNTTSATGHSYQVTRVVEPTKSESGYTVYTCSVCSHSYHGDITYYVPTEQEAYNSIIALKASYPDGTPWDNSDFYSWKGGIYTTGYGCAGFAFMLSDAAFGNLPARKSTDVSNLRVGDILRINNDGHSVVVLEVRDDGVIVAEGNLNNSVYWGRKIPYSTVNAPGTYILTRYPE